MEDRRFFEHGGINYVRLFEGVLAPVLHHRRMQGGSTLTMQMARSFFLSNERSVRRKLAEIMIAMQLEHRFTKPEIFAMYVNQVDMGQRGSFDIRGFGEAAQAYFGKNISHLSLPEAALLAGLVNGPSYYSPDRHPDRIIARRNLVLRAMFDNHLISREQLASAQVTSLKLAPPSAESGGDPYFMDLVRDQLLSQYTESELNNGGMRVYTSLDPQLQKAATESIEAGLKQVDEVIRQDAGERAWRAERSEGRGGGKGRPDAASGAGSDGSTYGRGAGASRAAATTARANSTMRWRSVLRARSSSRLSTPRHSIQGWRAIRPRLHTDDHDRCKRRNIRVRGGQSYSPRNFDASESTGWSPRGRRWRIPSIRRQFAWPR